MTTWPLLPGRGQPGTQLYVILLAAIKLVEKDHPEYNWPYANLAEPAD